MPNISANFWPVAGGPKMRCNLKKHTLFIVKVCFLVVSVVKCKVGRCTLHLHMLLTPNDSNLNCLLRMHGSM